MLDMLLPIIWTIPLIQSILVMKFSFASTEIRVIFMKDHIPIRPDRSLLLDRQTSKLDVDLHENDSLLLRKVGSVSGRKTRWIKCFENASSSANKNYYVPVAHVLDTLWYYLSFFLNQSINKLINKVYL